MDLPSWEQTKPVDSPQGASGDLPSWDQTFDPEEKYGGTSGELVSAGLGALRGGTLGVSDLAITKGASLFGKEKEAQEYLKGHQETNPLSSMGGEFAGTAASLALAPELSPAGLIGKAGKVVTGGAKALEAAKLASEGSIAAKVLGASGDIAAHAAGSATEGALYSGIGSTINEYALGDPNLNGEKILDNFGTGALYGGALGGVLKSAEIGIPESLKAAKTAVTGLRDFLVGSGENDAGLVGKLAPDSKITDYLANRMTNLDKDERIGIVREAAGKLNDATQNILTSVKDLNSKVRPQEADILINQSANPQVVKNFRQGFVTQINEALDAARNEPALYEQREVRKLEKIRDVVVDKMSEDNTPSDIFNHLKDRRPALRELAFPKFGSGQAQSDFAELARPIFNTLQEGIKSPEVFGLGGAAQAAHDEFLHSLYEFVPPGTNKATDFTKTFMKKEGTRWTIDEEKLERVFKRGTTLAGQNDMKLLNDFHDFIRTAPEHLENSYAHVPNENWGSEKLKNIIKNSEDTLAESHQKYVDSIQNQKGGLGLKDIAAAGISVSHPLIGAAYHAFNIASQPENYIRKLAELERVVGKTTATIGKGAMAIFDPSVRGLQKIQGFSAKQLSQEDRKDKAQKTFKDLSAMVNTPEIMIDRLNKATGEMSDTAPHTTQGAQQALMRGAQFLASKIPGPPHINPFSEAYVPSNMELAKFEHYQALIEKPTRALEEVRLGTLTPDTIETLSQVTPDLYAHMKQAVLSEATDRIAKGESIPFRTKQSISMFLGQPLSEALSPTAVMNNQAAFQTAQMEQPNPQAKKPSSSGMKELTLSARTKPGSALSSDV